MIKDIFSISGHEKVWHGFIDVIFSSHLGVPTIANVVLELDETPTRKRKIDGKNFKLHFVLLSKCLLAKTYVSYVRK